MMAETPSNLRGSHRECPLAKATEIAHNHSLSAPKGLANPSLPSLPPSLPRFMRVAFQRHTITPRWCSRPLRPMTPGRRIMITRVRAAIAAPRVVTAAAARGFAVARPTAMLAAAAASAGAVAYGGSQYSLAHAEPTPPAPPTVAARAQLLSELRVLAPHAAAADALLGRVDVTIKGARMSARLKLASDEDVLPALIPLLQHFPRVSWHASAEESPAGAALVLREAGPSSMAEAAPLISVFVPPAGRGGAEIELLGELRKGGDGATPPPPLRQRELRAVAQALCATLSTSLAN